MRIVYYDEAGDDGFPRYSSACFVLSALYMPYLAWRPNFEALQAFRRTLKGAIGLPVRTEFHTRQFLTNKNPFRELGIPEADRVAAIDQYCELLAGLDVRMINVCIDKTRIRKSTYPVLDWALKFSVQRIENDLRANGADDSRFLVITDPGRVGKMRRTGWIGCGPVSTWRLPAPTPTASSTTRHNKGATPGGRPTPPTAHSRFQWFTRKYTRGEGAIQCSSNGAERIPFGFDLRRNLRRHLENEADTSVARPLDAPGWRLADSVLDELAGEAE